MDLRTALPKLTIANASQSAFTEWCDEQVIITAHDNVAPSAPLLSAAVGNQQCILTLTKPTTDVNGKTNTDFDHFKVYYKSSSGVTTGEPSITTKSTNHAFSASARTYFKAAAVDIWGNESALSAEDDAIPTHDAAEIISNVPLDISSYNIIDDGNVVVGDHMIGVIFEPVPTSWVGFVYWKLYYSKNDGGWSAYTEIKNSGSAAGHVGSIGFNFKYESATPIDSTKAYRFKLTAVDIDDAESTTGCIADGVANAGYTPNATDNDVVLASIVMGTTIIATNEIRGEHIYAGSTIEIASGGYIHSGQTAYDTGTGWWLGDDSGVIKLSIGNSSGNKLLWTGSALEITGKVTASSGYIGGTSGWVIAAGKMTASGIGLATTTGDATYAFWAGNNTPASAEFRVTHAGKLYATGVEVSGAITATSGSFTGAIYASSGTFTGTITGSLIRTAAGNPSMVMASTGGNAHMLAITNAAAGITTLIESSIITLADASANSRIYLNGITSTMYFYTTSTIESQGVLTIKTTGSTGGIKLEPGADSNEAVHGAMKYSGALVHNGNAPGTSYTLLNLTTGSYVPTGARCLCLLEIVNNGGSQNSYYFKPYGETENQGEDPSDFPGACSCKNGYTNELNYVWAVTDTSGRLYWKSNDTDSVAVTLIGYFVMTTT